MALNLFHSMGGCVERYNEQRQDQIMIDEESTA